MLCRLLFTEGSNPSPSLPWIPHPRFDRKKNLKPPPSAASKSTINLVNEFTILRRNTFTRPPYWLARSGMIHPETVALRFARVMQGLSYNNNPWDARPWWEPWLAPFFWCRNGFRANPPSRRTRVCDLRCEWEVCFICTKLVEKIGPSIEPTTAPEPFRFGADEAVASTHSKAAHQGTLTKSI